MLNSFSCSANVVCRIFSLNGQYILRTKVRLAHWHHFCSLTYVSYRFRSWMKCCPWATRWTELLSHTLAFHVRAMVMCGSIADTILLNSSLLPNWPMIPMYFVSCFIKKLPTFAVFGTHFSAFGICLIGNMERRFRTNCAGSVAVFIFGSTNFSSNEQRKLIDSVIRSPPSANEMHERIELMNIMHRNTYHHRQLCCSQDFANLKIGKQPSMTWFDGAGLKVLTIYFVSVQFVFGTEQCQMAQRNFRHQRMMHLILIPNVHVDS